jgi:hypothetical protein
MKGAKTIQELTRHEFDTLKNMGFLWEIFPNAPMSFDEIKKMNKSDLELFFEEYDPFYVKPYNGSTWLNHYFLNNKYFLFGDHSSNNAEELMSINPYRGNSTLFTIDCLVNFIAHQKVLAIYDVINLQELLMVEKDRQYGNAVLNPKLFTIKEDEIGTVIRGLINNKLNRLIHQTDNEDAIADLLGYMIFLYIYEQKKDEATSLDKK